MINKNLIILGAVLVMVLVAAGVLLSGNKSATPVATSTPNLLVNPSTSPINEAVREINVSAFDFGYTPKLLSARAGEAVRIVLTNDGRNPHDFAIEGMDVRTDIVGPGESTTVDFVVPEGTSQLIFFCTIGNHRAQGMEGTINVN